MVSAPCQNRASYIPLQAILGKHPISAIENVGIQVGNVCVGVFTLMLGNSSGGPLAATGFAGLVAIGTEITAMSAKRVRARAQKRAILTLSATPEFSEVGLERSLVVMENSVPSLTRTDLIKASEEAVGLNFEAALALRVHRTLRFDGDDEATQQLLLRALEAGMRICSADSEFQADIQSVQLVHLLQQVARVRTDVDRVERKVDRIGDNLENFDPALLAQLVGSAVAEEARRRHVSEDLILNLAKRIAANVVDFNQALIEIERAVEIVVERRAEGSLPNGTDEAVSAVLAQVNRLNSEGRIDDAALLIERKIENVNEDLYLLLDRGIEQAILTRDIEKICAYELQKVTLEFPDADAQLRKLTVAQNEWLVRGRNDGSNLDLEIAIEIARLCCDRARNTMERHFTLDKLGVALWTLGERESDSAKLEQAIVVHENALHESVRGGFERGQAISQINLGNTLWVLGERESGNARLEQALCAACAALESLVLEYDSSDWNASMTLLGNVHRGLGLREEGTGRLKYAVAAFREALKDTASHDALAWAQIHTNLGGVLQSIGAREWIVDWLQQASASYEEALGVGRANDLPLICAAAQNNIGNVAITRGAISGDAKWFREAIFAFREALGEWKRERVPLDWALAQRNLGEALGLLGEAEKDLVILNYSIDAYNDALEECTRDRVPLEWARIKTSIARRKVAVANLSPNSDRIKCIQEALSYVEAALEIFNRESTPSDRAGAMQLRALLRERLNV